jgi:hypothetical protein
MSFLSLLPRFWRGSLVKANAKRLTLTCALLGATTLLSMPVQAQQTDSQFWTLLTFNARYSNKYRLYVEAQPRLGQHYQRYTQFLFRPAVGYQLNKTVSLWLGYGWTPTFQPTYINENRIFQQVLVENRYPGFDMQNRTRLEQRSIEGAGETAWRIRHQIRVAKPLGTGSRWQAVAYNELFWNLNSTPSGPQSGFDQNRPYVGMGYTINKHTRVELGYLAMFLNPPRNRPNRRLDTLVLSANYNL